VNVGYYRTWYGGRCGGSALTNTITCLLVTRNLTVNPATDYDAYCITTPGDSRLPGGGGQRLCDLYDLKPAKFGLAANNLVEPYQAVGGRYSSIYNGFDATINARFGHGGSVSGGTSIGRTSTDNCIVVNSLQDARPGYCKTAPPWASGTQGKFMVVYPLIWDIQTSAIYQNSTGIPISAQLVLPNAAILSSLGRNLSDCAATGACNATRTIDIIPPATMYERRLQQVDLRLTKAFALGGTSKVRANLDIYNVLNANNVLNQNTSYSGDGSTWRDVTQKLSGRLLRIGVQYDF
jgi:hypothetical protein